MSTRQMDMIQGPIFSKLVRFSIPVIASGILQLLFNTADVIVVGRFSGSQALAAVGSTSSLINLLINLFLGISIGANVLVGQYIGAKDEPNARKTVHTGILFAFCGGIFMAMFGFFLSSTFLQMMSTPSDVLPLSTLYMKIYFLGLPALLVYDFGAALLRAIGDTKRPLYFLSISGIINVILNLCLVIFFGLGVAGVAIATVTAQLISAILILICLARQDGVLRLEKEYLHFSRDKAVKMIKIGVPAGVQGMLFSISNVLIQSSINGFGSIVMAGNTASSNIENFVYISMNSIHQSALSFTSQNMGAGQYKRIDKILLECLGIVCFVGLVLGWIAYLGSDFFLGIYSTNLEVIEVGTLRLSVICTMYFICGCMDVMVGTLRGMGASFLPMVVTLLGVCAFRVFWVFTIFKASPTLWTLYISYPVSWLITLAALVVCYISVRKKLKRIV